WITAVPSARPMTRARQLAGKETIAASRITIASTPLQPLRMLTPKRGDCSAVPLRVTCWPSRLSAPPLARDETGERLDDVVVDGRPGEQGEARGEDDEKQDEEARFRLQCLRHEGG